MCRTCGPGYPASMAKDETPNQERLEELGDRIERARRQAEEDIPEMSEESDNMWLDADPAFVDSGDHPEEDDQTIAPPV